ncbi:hypothetical protein BG005_001334, partial [Podila minutissima]
MSLTVPSSPGTGGLLNHSAGSRSEAPTITIGSTQLSPCNSANNSKGLPILGDPVELSTLAPIAPVKPPGAKKGRGILKPRIITSSPPMADSGPQMGLSPGGTQPKGHFRDSGTSIRKIDSHNTDGSSIRSGGFSLGRRPSLSPDDQ